MKNITHIPTSPKNIDLPQAMLEELNVLRVEGRYFCFDKHALASRSGILTYKDGDRTVVIEVSRHGHPSILAYRVLQAAFRKVTLEGRPFPDTISFTYRELAQLIGRDIIGGQDAKEIFRAIRQLEDTRIELVLHRRDSVETYQSCRFNMFAGTGFIAEGDELSPRKIRQAVITLHPFIMNSMRKGHFAIFNWHRISELQPLTAALYKRLYLHLSNLFENKYDRESLKFEKDYGDICAEWLGGLKPQQYKSKIMEQLGPHLDALKECGIVRSVSVDKKADGGWKLVFKPGTNFFRDYELFYMGSRARILQFQNTADQHTVQLPFELAKKFYTLVHGKFDNPEGIISQKDADFGKSLIQRFGEEAALELISFTVDEAKKTRFDMRSFRAVETFVPKWQAGREGREAARRHATTIAKQQEEDRLQREYEEVISSEIFDAMEKLSPIERETLKQEALLAMPEDSKDPSSMTHALALKFTARRIMRDRLSLPTFETWKKARL